jgi:ribosome maturation protein Sdo1
MEISGHIVGLLKGYMQDLVEQAKQEESAHESFGFSPVPYRSDQAISDLLAILDDRIESEGVQVGLSPDFLHRMWGLCNEAGTQIAQQVWLETGGEHWTSKARIRELTYRALVDVLEERERT